MQQEVKGHELEGFLIRVQEEVEQDLVLLVNRTRTQDLGEEGVDGLLVGLL